MDRQQLMAQYGELLIQAEIIQGKINECKGQIARLLNQPPVLPVKEPNKDPETK